MELNPTTVVFEIINFVALLWLLSKLLYRPLRRAIVEREQSMADKQAQIDQRLQEVSALREEWEQKTKQLGLLADQVRSQALAEAVTEQGRMLSQAREDAAAERRKAQALVSAERDAAEQWVRNFAVERSAELAGRLLNALVPHEVDQALTDRLLEEIEHRGEALLGPQSGAEPIVEVAAVRTPPDSVLTRLRTALAAQLSSSPRLTVSEDPELQAGLRLRIGDRVIDGTLAGQLQAFQALARDLAAGDSHG